MLHGKIQYFSRLGGIIPSFSVQEFFDAGFVYGDLVTIHLGNDGIYTVPFVTNYTDAGCLGLALVDYRASHRWLVLSLCNDTLTNILDVHLGEEFSVELRAKGGYLENYQDVGTIYSDVRSEYASDAEFANFREIRTTGLVPKLLYRSSNPLNSKHNQARRATAERLCQEAGILYEVDLGDDASDIEEALVREPQLADTYCAQLYRAGNVSLTRLKGGALAGEGAQQVAEAFRFLLRHPGPFLIHCDEGKDRAGFVCLLLEALAGATLEDLRRDYMQTFCNYYHLVPHTEKYERIRKMNVDRLLYIIAHPEEIAHLLGANWEMLNIESLEAQAAARRYCRWQLHLTEAEVMALQAKLQGRGLTLR